MKPSRSRIEVLVPPRFCDAQGMVHASRYHEFLEDAFLRWLDDKAMSYEALRATGLDLVIGTTTIRYRRPAHLGDRLHVTAQAVHSTPSTVTVDFAVARDPAAVIAEATITYVAVRKGTSAPLPPELAVPDRDDPSPPTLLERLHNAQARLYAGGSDEPLTDVLHPDVSWHVPGKSPIAGHYAGRAAVIAYMERRRDLADRSFRMQTDEVLVGPSYFAALTRGTAVIAGASHGWKTIGLYRCEDGLIKECFLLPFDQEAFDRIWSEPS
jgi:YbgC/YbaW family acyl-CoA thioester hydrolase